MNEMDWRELGVPRNAHLMKPPEWMVKDTQEIQDRLPDLEQYAARMKRRQDITQHHWNSAVNALHREAGYRGLLEMRNRLSSKIEEIRGVDTKWSRRIDYLRMILRVYGDFISKSAISNAEQNSVDSENRDEQKELEQLLTSPVIKSFITVNETGHVTEFHDSSDWMITGGYVASGELSEEEENAKLREWKNFNVHYRPSEEILEGHGLPAELRLLDLNWKRLKFGGATTWQEAFDEIKATINEHREKRQPVKRTLELTQFRFKVIENVIHRYELFGTVEQMGIEEAERISVEQVFEGKSRPHGSKATVHPEVKEWAVAEYFNQLSRQEKTFEEAKDQVINIAESFNYHFARRSLERWIQSK